MLVTPTPSRTRRSSPSRTSTSTAPRCCSPSATARSGSSSPASTRGTRTPEAAREEIEELVAHREGASGVAALADGEVAGFLARRARATRAGGRTSGSSRPATPSVRRRARARPLRRRRGALGRRRPHARTTRWCRRPTPRSSTRGSGSASATSRSTRSARRRPRTSGAGRTDRADAPPRTSRRPRRARRGSTSRCPSTRRASPVFSHRPLPTRRDAEPRSTPTSTTRASRRSSSSGTAR